MDTLNRMSEDVRAYFDKRTKGKDNKTISALLAYIDELSRLNRNAQIHAETIDAAMDGVKTKRD